MRKAIEMGSTDNISCLVVYTKKLVKKRESKKKNQDGEEKKRARDGKEVNGRERVDDLGFCEREKICLCFVEFFGKENYMGKKI